MEKYVSSIMCKYGDRENIKKDSATLFEIIDRQGFQFIIDVLSERSATYCAKFKFNDNDRKNIVDSLLKDLKEALNERI